MFFVLKRKVNENIWEISVLLNKRSSQVIVALRVALCGMRGIMILRYAA
jgi:hypothetical protein